MRTRIKICGISTAPTALAAAASGADAIGLVFVEGSPRCVDVAQARRITAALPPFVTPVGLFVDEPAQRVRETVDAVGLGAVQLHGAETPEQAADLSPLPTVKALPFEAERMRQVLRPWRGSRNLSGLLLDRPPPTEAAVPGGHGHRLNWRELATQREAGVFDALPPLILAGGLDPENVGEAITVFRPYAVDVSSGVETARGVKDATRIADFCRAVRQAEGLRSADPVPDVKSSP